MKKVNWIYVYMEFTMHTCGDIQPSILCNMSADTTCALAHVLLPELGSCNEAPTHPSGNGSFDHQSVEFVRFFVPFMSCVCAIHACMHA